MLERMQLFPLNFYKKQKFTGSMGKMNYHLEKAEITLENEEKKTVFKCSVWKGPFCYDVTPQEEIKVTEYPFSEDGMNEVLNYLNEEGKKFNQPHIL